MYQLIIFKVHFLKLIGMLPRLNKLENVELQCCPGQWHLKFGFVMKLQNFYNLVIPLTYLKSLEVVEDLVLAWHSHGSVSIDKLRSSSIEEVSFLDLELRLIFWYFFQAWILAMWPFGHLLSMSYFLKNDITNITFRCFHLLKILNNLCCLSIFF